MLLDVSDLHAGYGRHRVLSGVTLAVDRGELVCVIGTNGAGKTTLLRSIIGSLRPTHGRVLLSGTDITRWRTDKSVRFGLALVPEGRHIFPGMTVADHLMVGARRQARSHRTELMAIAYDLFPRLQERQRQMAGSLSGGEQQMLVLARALMGEPELLLIDEPSLGLAPLVIEDIFEAISRLRDGGMTTVIVEQNARLALEVADRGYVLEQGRVAVEGAAGLLLHDARVTEAYLRTGVERDHECGEMGPTRPGAAAHNSLDQP